MRIGNSNGAQKCTICMRKKQEAIDEQVKQDNTCDVPNCPFHDEIQRAIEAEHAKHKFTFDKPKFTFRKSKFSFGRKTKK